MAEEATATSVTAASAAKPNTINGDEREAESLAASSQVDTSGTEGSTEPSTHDVTEQTQPPVNPVSLIFYTHPY